MSVPSYQERNRPPCFWLGLNVDPTKFCPGKNTIVAVDSVGAGEGEMVLFCQGSSARLAPNMKVAPVDAVIIGIVDVVDVLGKQIFNSKL
jgi:ethanolamine utilization protein EutN